MSGNLFRSAYLDLDADSGSTDSSFRNTPKNIYWKNKVNVMHSYKMSNKLENNQFFFLVIYL